MEADKARRQLKFESGAIIIIVTRRARQYLCNELSVIKANKQMRAGTSDDLDFVAFKFLHAICSRE